MWSWFRDRKTPIPNKVKLKKRWAYSMGAQSFVWESTRSSSRSYSIPIDRSNRFGWRRGCVMCTLPWFWSEERCWRWRPIGLDHVSADADMMIDPSMQSVPCSRKWGIITNWMVRFSLCFGSREEPMNSLILNRVSTVSLTWKSVWKSMVFGVFIILDYILFIKCTRSPNIPTDIPWNRRAFF